MSEVCSLLCCPEESLLPAALRRSGLLRIEDAERLQQLPEGHTAPCYPVAAPGVGGHRAARARDADAQVGYSRSAPGALAAIATVMTSCFPASCSC
jgi:hypothetical protein